MAKSIGLLHLNLNVTDIVRSEYFYQQVFGYIRIADSSGEIHRRGQDLFFKQIIMGIPEANDLLALTELAGETVGPDGMSHFGIVMEDDDEVEALTDRVESCGGTIIEKGVREENGIKEPFAYIRDPDGYAIEIASQKIVYSMDFRRAVTTMRSYKGESDLQPLVDLFDACEKVDKVEFSISTSQLRLSLEAPGIDRDRDLQLWEDAKGQLIGFGELSIEEPTEDNLVDGRLWFVVHPIARGGDIEQQIIAWAESRMNGVGKERRGRPRLFTWSRDSRADRVAIIKHHGFEEDRHFLFSSRSLTGEIPKPQLPKGFTIRSVNAEQEAQSWVDLYNQSFIGSWNYHPLTVDKYKRGVQNPNYLPKLHLVTIDPDGNFAAACYCSIDKAHNTFIGRQEGWVVFLFTSPSLQRQGLARAMLLHGLAQLQALQMDIAMIGVDSENAFGAKRLYESVGFKHLYTNIAYVKHL